MTDEVKQLKDQLKESEAKLANLTRLLPEVFAELAGISKDNKSRAEYEKSIADKPVSGQKFLDLLDKTAVFVQFVMSKYEVSSIEDIKCPYLKEVAKKVAALQ